jgi:protein-disulfide isomerase
MSETPRSSMRLQTVLDLLATVAFIAAAVAFVWTIATGRLRPMPAEPVRAAAPPARRLEPPLPAEPVSLTGAETKGSARARIALIEYSDFQCPFCGKFAKEVLPDIDREYVSTGRLLVAFRQLPLAIHSLAEKAAEASECAARQGKFWPMHDWLFRETPRLEEPRLLDAARELSLDRDQFRTCLGGAELDQVRSDAALAKSLGIIGTPAFLAGVIQPDGRVKITKRLAGAQPYAQFKAVIESLITADAGGSR